MQKTVWISAAVVLIIIIALVAYVSARPSATTDETATTTPVSTETAGTGNAAVGATGESVVVTYTSSGFSPSSVTVAPGTTVTWVNETDSRMWVGGDDHPTHTHYDGTSTSEHCRSGAPVSPAVFDQCNAGVRGASYSFTFTKAGAWDYHNHARSSDQGTVTVTGS